MNDQVGPKYNASLESDLDFETSSIFLPNIITMYVYAPPVVGIGAEKSENWKSIPIVPFDVNGKISSMQSKQLIVMSLE